MNKTILIGRLCKEIELLKTTAQGVLVVKNTLAVEDRFNKEKTNFIPIIFWRKQAEFINNYTYKGQKIAIIGELKQEQYTDRNGEKHNSFVVSVEEVELLERKVNNENKPELMVSNLEEVNDDLMPF